MRSSSNRSRRAFRGSGWPVPDYTATEIMTIEAARRLANGTVCFVGIGMPSAAANLARLTHAPEVVLIYESGTIGAKPDVLPLSIGDGELAIHADTVVSIPEIFRYWLQGGRVDVGFLGAAQVDRFGNINTTVIGGTYEKPKVRLPGAGGAPEIASSAKEVWIIIKQSPRSFVERLDFMTSVGHLAGGDSRANSGARGKGPTAVITDLGVLAPDPHTRELTLVALHPGVTIEQAKAATGWDLKIAREPATSKAPTQAELAALRDLHARTAKAHGTAGASSE
jgi:glutaconate CoA-transferase subunit B